MITVVDDPDDHTLEELIQEYLKAGFDQESAEAYAGILKNPPPGVRID